jgi:hypothetical protein
MPANPGFYRSTLDEFGAKSAEFRYATASLLCGKSLLNLDSRIK